MSSMTITELRRIGASVLEETPVKFIWDAKNHSMMQDTLDLELQINTNREMPAGAEEPVEQVQSVEWPAIDIHGEWKDQWAGQGFADKTRIEFTRLCGRASEVKIELGPHVLIGLITNFKIKWRTLFEVGYAFKFSIHQNAEIGSFSNPDIVPQTAINFSQRIQDQQDSIDRVSSLLDTVKTLPWATEDRDNADDNFNDLIAAVDKAKFATDAAAFENTTDTVDFAEMLDRAQHKLLAVAASFSSIRGQAQENLLDVQDLISTDVLAYDDVVGTLRFEEWSRTQQSECVKMIGSAKSSEIDARNRAARRPRGVHRVRSGDTLDRVSMKWYGSPDSGRYIRDANNLDSILLPVGVDLIIPDINR